MVNRQVVLTSPVRVTRAVDSWQKLIHTLQNGGNGSYIVTVHNGQVVKIAAVDKAVKVADLAPLKGVIPGP